MNRARRFALAVTLVAAGCRLPDYRDVEVQEICQELGRAMTDRERIMKALEYHYESDEILLRDFSKGTKPSVEAQLRRIGFQDSHGKFHKTASARPPFVPLHFQAYKRAIQRMAAQAKMEDIVDAYYRDFPGCCEVVEPQWKREKWDGIRLGAYGQIHSQTNWNRDVWVRSIYPFRRIVDDWNNLGNKKVNSNQVEYIQRRGELGVTACGKTPSNDRGQGS